MLTACAGLSGHARTQGSVHVFGCRMDRPLVSRWCGRRLLEWLLAPLLALCRLFICWGWPPMHLVYCPQTPLVYEALDVQTFLLFSSRVRHAVPPLRHLVSNQQNEELFV